MIKIINEYRVILTTCGITGLFIALMLYQAINFWNALPELIELTLTALPA